MQASLSLSRQRQNGAAGAAIGAREDARPPGPAAFRPLRRGRGHRSARSLPQENEEGRRKNAEWSGGRCGRLGQCERGKCSLMFAYVRVCSLNWEKMFEAGGVDQEQRKPNPTNPDPIRPNNPRDVQCRSQNGEAGAARGHYGKPKLINSERAMKNNGSAARGHRRLGNRETGILSTDCAGEHARGTSQMRALRGATGGGSEPPNCRFRISDRRLGNTEQPIADCKMHEMMGKRSRCGTSVSRSQVAQATGLYRRATRRAERGSHPNPIRTNLGEEVASIFRSAGRPCYPFSGHPLKPAKPN